MRLIYATNTSEDIVTVSTSATIPWRIDGQLPSANSQQGDRSMD